MSHNHINFFQKFETYLVKHSLQNKEIQLTECTCSKSEKDKQWTLLTSSMSSGVFIVNLKQLVFVVALWSLLLCIKTLH